MSNILGIATFGAYLPLLWATASRGAFHISALDAS